MPYITPTARAILGSGGTIQTPGELNYSLTQVIKKYLEAHGKSYQTFNDILGALEGAKLELYRREISKYEDEKRKINGDVY